VPSEYISGAKCKGDLANLILVQIVSIIKSILYEAYIKSVPSIGFSGLGTIQFRGPYLKNKISIFLFRMVTLKINGIYNNKLYKYKKILDIKCDRTGATA
jgi:hypothetical protein